MFHGPGPRAPYLGAKISFLCWFASDDTGYLYAMTLRDLFMLAFGKIDHNETDP